MKRITGYEKITEGSSEAWRSGLMDPQKPQEHAGKCVNLKTKEDPWWAALSTLLSRVHAAAQQELTSNMCLTGAVPHRQSQKWESSVEAQATRLPCSSVSWWYRRAKNHGFLTSAPDFMHLPLLKNFNSESLTEGLWIYSFPPYPRWQHSSVESSAFISMPTSHSS